MSFLRVYEVRLRRGASPREKRETRPRRLRRRTKRRERLLRRVVRKKIPNGKGGLPAAVALARGAALPGPKGDVCALLA